MFPSFEAKGEPVAERLKLARQGRGVADDVARGGWDRWGTGESGEGGLVSQPPLVRPGEQDVRGGDRADAWLGEQLGGELADERDDLALELTLLECERLDADGKQSHRQQGAAQLAVCMPARTCAAQAAHEPRPGERTQLGSPRLGAGGGQRAQLIEGGAPARPVPARPCGG